MGGEQKQLPPVGELGPGLAEGAIEVLGLPPLHDALAVGRVGDDAAILPAPVEGTGVVHVKAHHIVHLGQLGVVPGQLHRLGVDVSAPDLVVPVKLLVHGLVGGAEPQLLVHKGPLLGGEGAAESGGPVLGDEGGLDGDGAAAAEGVAQGVPALVPGQQHHGGGQSLPQRGSHALGPVATLMQPRSAGIQHQGGLILHDGKLDLIEGPRLGQGVHTVFAPQPGGHRLLDDGLAGGHRVQCGVQAVSLHRELPLAGDEPLPGQGAGALEEGVKVLGVEAAQHQQHPLSGAQVQVQPGDVPGGAGTQHPAVLRLDFQPQAAHLIGADPFQSKQGGDGKRQLLQNIKPP